LLDDHVVLWKLRIRLALWLHEIRLLLDEPAVVFRRSVLTPLLWLNVRARVLRLGKESTRLALHESALLLPLTPLQKAPLLRHMGRLLRLKAAGTVLLATEAAAAETA
jgi:hypothetical protein